MALAKVEVNDRKDLIVRWDPTTGVGRTRRRFSQLPSQKRCVRGDQIRQREVNQNKGVSRNRFLAPIELKVALGWGKS